MQNYLAAAKVLDELMLALLGKGLTAPPHVVEDLKAGRALANMSARQQAASQEPGNAELEGKIAPALERVEMNLLALAEMAEGAAFADLWQGKIAGAYQSPPQAPPLAGKMQGVPRDAYPIRIQSSALAGCAPAEALDLTVTAQEDGYTLIYGTKENISVFLKDIRRQQEQQGKVGFKRDSN
ncbi:MAG: hypothetical protein FWE98_02105 [Oscillospiraceae bacterium]|nr:hypothetical protein [Oscillospiraceae bacterium]